MLINASNVSKSFGEVKLFDGVTFNIELGDKIGFIGSNGAGKSTLFKIILDEVSYDSGELYFSKDLNIGYLDQYSCKDSKHSILDETLTVFSDLIAMEKELEEIQLEIELGNSSPSIIARQHYLNEQFISNDGLVYRAKTKSALIGLGFHESELNSPVSNLSGGQKTRVELAKIILSNKDLLLLDEPTNHLDIDSTQWLERYLMSYKGAYIVISHDRYFLDKTTNKIFELDNGQFNTYNGNYTAYKAQKDVIAKTLERQYENTTAEIKRLEGVIEQQRRWNREKNIKTAESKQKVVDKLKADVVEPLKPHELMRYSLKSCGECGNDVLIVSGLSKTFDGSRYLFKDVDMYIKKHDNIFLLGPNGCGKTTILKIIQNYIDATCGEVKLGSNVKIGYYDQLQENLSENKTIFDEISDTFPSLTMTQIRNVLASFFFFGEDVFKQISTLSGGEKSRVELAKLILKDVNFLILDEPTNHLDIWAKEALETALQNYDGTMLVVSHDRYFINKLASKILYLENEGLTTYLGNYDDFNEKRQNSLEASSNLSINNSAKSVDQTKETNKQAYLEKKAFEREKRKAVSDLAKLEDKIADIESEIEDINTQLMSEEVASDYVKSVELSSKLEQLNAELDETYKHWDEINLKLEEFNNE